jgi:hypothetical protein
MTIDGSDANEAAIKNDNEEHGTTIIIRQVKYLHNIVEQNHRAVKRVTRPILGFKSFEAGQTTFVGIERMHMIKKRQMVGKAGDEALLRLNSSTLSPPHPLTTGGFSPQIGSSSEIATKLPRELGYPWLAARRRHMRRGCGDADNMHGDCGELCMPRRCRARC